MKRFLVVYLSHGGTHYRYRCVAKNKREARRECREYMGISNNAIVEVIEEVFA